MNKEASQKKARLGLIAALFLLLLLGVLMTAAWPGSWGITETPIRDIGITLFEDYGIAFLIVGVVLFVSMMGGVYLAQEEKE
ncbi:NADH-quinone oxidoreductase subunit J [Methanomassiliicoccus luminyensis]|jgi:NADH:ubiquinone oxidoreductase subunit 6 (subunit J)|uniref:NADH-quinone oxidoreductase subunit J n=1 Tax=Methanomassiliicoccus luminyensis TaxID=1080712 RepID=UPI00038041A1|nr:NADH-quinone oxidoreductase subunit J [Methanomassiliicoccus luminyensis]